MVSKLHDVSSRPGKSNPGPRKMERMPNANFGTRVGRVGDRCTDKGAGERSRIVGR